ncbi:MAG: MATE family efflux transporter [Pseudomonadota bacterium]
MSEAQAAPVTNRRILKIALPIVLSNATVPILGAVDTGVVGQMGEAAPIGAVGIGAVILSALYWIFGFLRMGTTALVAQSRGAGDTDEAGAIFMRGLLIAWLGALLFILGQALLFAGAFWLSPASAEVETLARDYLAIRIWGAPATISLYVVTGWLIAVERTRGILVLQLWMNGLNIVLDLWFVLGLGWGVQGVAIATLIAEWTGLALGLWLCRDLLRAAPWRDLARIADPTRLRRLLAVNRDILLRNLILTLCFGAFVFWSSDFGDVSLAANKILLQFFELTAFALDGFAFAAETLVGQAVGAQRRAELRRATILACYWGIIGGAALGVIFWVAGPWIIDLMSTSEAVRSEARSYLPWMIIAPLLAAVSFMLDGVFFGATWTRDLLKAMVISVAIYVTALLVLVPWLGNHGLWAALMVLSVARGVTLFLRYPRLERTVGAA